MATRTRGDRRGTPSRRDFLAAGVASVALPALAEDPTAMPPVIDTHQHLWDLSKIKLSWGKPGEPLAKSFLPADYAAATAGLNVVKSVYMEVDVVPEDQQKEADYVVGLCESGKTPMVAAVVGGWPDADGFARYAGQFKGSKTVKGVRRVLHAESTPAGFCLDPKFVKGVQLLGELGLSFDLCVRPAELPDMGKLIDRCPDTRFILDHCGNPQLNFTKEQWAKWRKDMAAIAGRKNVVCKVSGFIVNGDPKLPRTAETLAPGVNGTIEAFGTDRVMFGGDWPVVTVASTYKGWLTTLKEIIAGRPAADQAKLLHDNAAKVYGI